MQLYSWARRTHEENVTSISFRQSSLLAPRLAKADCGEIRICDATSFVDDMPVTRCAIKAGDSAITIDPLSSQGVQTALGTAIHAAVVLNTILDRPEHADLAMDYYRRRIFESASFHALAAGELYCKQREFTPSTFWNERASNHRPIEQHRRSSLASLGQRVQVSSRATFAPVATATDRYVIQANGVELDGTVYPRVGNFNVSDLLQSATRPMVAKDLLQHW